jgi:hypothetical protein
LSNVLNSTITLRLPVITALSLNNGATSTTGSTVTLTNIALNGDTSTPAYYMASELPTFAKIINTTTSTVPTWLPYTPSPVFTLSGGYTAKTIYVKVKSASGAVSNVKYAVITRHAALLKTASAKPGVSGVSRLSASSTLSTPSASSTPSTAPESGIFDIQALQATGYALSSDAAQPGAPFSAALTLGNFGAADAGRFHVALYLLTDESLLDGWLADEVLIDGLLAGEQTTAVFEFLTPNLGDGTAIVWPVFALDNRSELAPFDASRLVKTNALLTVSGK